MKIEKYFEFLESDNSFLENRMINLEDIWKNTYLPSQERKWKENNLNNEQIVQSQYTIYSRSNLLMDIFEKCNCGNFAEVGTAEGFQVSCIQSIINNSKEEKSAFSCDIRDARANSINYKFVLGDSRSLSEKIKSESKKIDLFWIDGAHDKYSVIYDIINLKDVQSETPIWVFDDFDTRFGAYDDLRFLVQKFSLYSRIIELGITGSGNPNTILLIGGKI